MLLFLSIVTLLVWLYFTFCHGDFWKLDQQLTTSPPPENWPSVTVIIPARDEVASIWPVIASHLATDYAGPFDVVLVDDNSSDGTGDLAKAAANNDPRLTILIPPSLPEGWTGKLWALHAGLEAIEAQQKKPDYLLFTDADIVHKSSTLSKLVAKAETEKLDLVSLMARLDARGFWGSTLIPAFIYFFMKLYPFKKANTPHSGLAAAAGGCMLINRERLQNTGGLAKIKDNLIDDCALARQLKNTQPRAAIFLGMANHEVISIRNNKSFKSVWNMVTRTAFTQLDYSILKLIGTVIGMILVYLAAPAIALSYPWHHQNAAFYCAIIATLLMLITYTPTVLHYKKNIWMTLFLPLTAVFYTFMTISSALRYWNGKGGAWKGRHYENLSADREKMTE